MKRRTFLKTSAVLAGATGLAGIDHTAFGASRAPLNREYYELRAWRCKAGAARDALEAFLRDAMIPAFTKLGAGPVGVFFETQPKDSETIFVLAPWPDLSAYARGTQWLRQSNRQKQSPAAKYLDAPKDGPAYDRIDSWLLLAFAGMPGLELPIYCKEKKPERLFELRTYESHSEAKALLKVDMFNEGEIQIMREVGLAPVFYGEALAGPNLPHLTYMTSAENEEAHKAHWAAFVAHPKWDIMKNDLKYADTVSRITKWILKPAAYSQI